MSIIMVHYHGSYTATNQNNNQKSNMDSPRAQKRSRHSSRSVCLGCTCCDWVDACQCIQEHWDFSDYSSDPGYGYHCFCCYWGFLLPWNSAIQYNGRKQFAPSDFREPFPVLAADVLLASRRGKETGLSTVYPQIALEAAALLDLKPTFFVHEKYTTCGKQAFCKPPRGAPTPKCYCFLNKVTNH
jgi:hypothetical protein